MHLNLQFLPPIKSLPPPDDVLHMSTYISQTVPEIPNNPFHRNKSIKLQHHMSFFSTSTTGKSSKNQTIKMHISCLYKKTHHLSVSETKKSHTCITFLRFHCKIFYFSKAIIFDAILRMQQIQTSTSCTSTSFEEEIYKAPKLEGLFFMECFL